MGITASKLRLLTEKVKDHYQMTSVLLLMMAVGK